MPRGGNCVKVDVGYAGAAPYVREIINSRRRAVTKVRACRLVSRSVSGRMDSSSPRPVSAISSSAVLLFFFPFLASVLRPPLSLSLSTENPPIDPRAIIHQRPQPSSASITRTLLVLSSAAYTSEVFLSAIISLPFAAPRNQR